jgi:hypothetical protein
LNDDDADDTNTNNNKANNALPARQVQANKQANNSHFVKLMSGCVQFDTNICCICSLKLNRYKRKFKKRMQKYELILRVNLTATEIKNLTQKP